VLLALKEVLETDNDSVYKSVESAHIDTSTITQASSLSNITGEKRKVRTDDWE